MDMDIILLTAVISTLFIVFIIAVYREFAVMENETYVFQKETGPRAGLVNFVGNLASNKSLTASEKKLFIRQCIAISQIWNLMVYVLIIHLRQLFKIKSRFWKKLRKSHYQKQRRLRLNKYPIGVRLRYI